MSSGLRARLVSPSTLLILATIAPIIGAIIGNLLAERGELGMLAGIVVTVALAIATVARPEVERRWYIMAALPVLFWILVTLWFTLSN